jgi:predicted metal-dependent phosphoesterase TrpH
LNPWPTGHGELKEDRILSFADLHTHTYCSDGITSPSELVSQVLSTPGLKYFALTDHDSLSGIEPVFRALKNHPHRSGSSFKRFIPGLEFSLFEPQSESIVHMVGLFPHVNSDNHRAELRRIDDVIGDTALAISRQRGLFDLDERMEQAYRVNLDGIGDRYESAEEIIRFVRENADGQNDQSFDQMKKSEDVIQHPIPITYQCIIDQWEALFPQSGREKTMLYILRPSMQKKEQLCQLFMKDGLSQADASELANTRQGILVNFKRKPRKRTDTFTGLDLIHRAGGISILAHPAVDHYKISYADFDWQVLFPLIEKGLKGIEVYYPYDPTYRQEASAHYLAIARKHNLLISGGTDYHGDGRSELSEIQLSCEYADRIINSHS